MSTTRWHSVLTPAPPLRLVWPCGCTKNDVSTLQANKLPVLQ